MRIIAYKNEVVLPLTLSPRNAGGPIELDLKIDLGVCKDICMPMHLNVSAKLAQDGTRAPQIVAALLDQPGKGPGPMRCAVEPTATGLQVQLTVPHTPAPAVIETGDSMFWVSEPVTQSAPGGMTATAMIEGQGTLIDRSALRLTLLPPHGEAVEYLGCD